MHLGQGFHPYLLICIDAIYEGHLFSDQLAHSPMLLDFHLPPLCFLILTLLNLKLCVLNLLNLIAESAFAEGSLLLSLWWTVMILKKATSLAFKTFFITSSSCTASSALPPC